MSALGTEVEMVQSERIRATFETVAVGEQLGPVEYDLSEQAVRDYIELVGDIDADRLRLPDGRVASPPSVIGGDYSKVLSTKYSTYDVVHTHAQHRFLRPIVPPVHVISSGTVIDKYIRRGREYLVIETVTRDSEGHDLAVSRNTWLINASTRHETDIDGAESTGSDK